MKGWGAWTQNRWLSRASGWVSPPPEGGPRAVRPGRAARAFASAAGEADAVRAAGGRTNATCRGRARSCRPRSRDRASRRRARPRSELGQAGLVEARADNLAAVRSISIRIASAISQADLNVGGRLDDLGQGARSRSRVQEGDPAGADSRARLAVDELHPLLAKLRRRGVDVVDPVGDVVPGQDRGRRRTCRRRCPRRAGTRARHGRRRCRGGRDLDPWSRTVSRWATGIRRSPRIEASAESRSSTATPT